MVQLEASKATQPYGQVAELMLRLKLKAKRRSFVPRRNGYLLSQEEYAGKVYSSLTKLVRAANVNLSYSTIQTKLHRARQAGKTHIELKDGDGNTVVIQIQQIE